MKKLISRNSTASGPLQSFRYRTEEINLKDEEDDDDNNDDSNDERLVKIKV